MVGIDAQAHEVQGMAAPGNGNLHTIDKPEAHFLRSRAGDGQAAHVIVVCQRQHIHIHLARPLDQRRRLEARRRRSWNDSGDRGS
jgi:hypothetical protein